MASKHMLTDVGFLIVCHFIFFDFLKVFKLYFKLHRHTVSVCRHTVSTAIQIAHVGLSEDNIQELVSSSFWVLWN